MINLIFRATNPGPFSLKEDKGCPKKMYFLYKVKTIAIFQATGPFLSWERGINKKERERENERERERFLPTFVQ